MQQKLVWMVPTAVLLTGVLTPLAYAHETSVSSATVGLNVQVETTAQTASPGSSVNAKSARATSTFETGAAARENNNSEANASGKARATSTANVGGAAQADEHRSAVATFVQSLLTLANRMGGVGEEVRAVARAQMDSASTTAKAIAQVESRSALRTLLFGADYKNIGTLRSEIATTSAHIARLKKALEKTFDASAKAELSSQIDALVDAQADVEAFVEAHEDSFSLFGWFTKRFAN
jgi:hypothetical protein